MAQVATDGILHHCLRSAVLMRTEFGGSRSFLNGREVKNFDQWGTPAKETDS
jgi:hypothetical protein